MTVVRPRLGSLGLPAAPALSSERNWARLYRIRLLVTDSAIVLASTIGAIR